MLLTGTSAMSRLKLPKADRHYSTYMKRLTLNLSKTKYLVFQPRQKVNSSLHPPLKIADQYLEQSFNIKYLGLVIDCFLSWHDHIDHISSKISKSVNIIAKLKRHVTKQSLISIYYALVYP